MQEKMGRMHVQQTLTREEQVSLLRAFERMDPGENEVSIKARCGVIHVDSVHPALAAK